MFFSRMLRSEFKPLGPGTGVDKLSSGCCLVSMGELSYMALFFSAFALQLDPAIVYKAGWPTRCPRNALYLCGFDEFVQTILRRVTFC